MGNYENGVHRRRSLWRSFQMNDARCVNRRDLRLVDMRVRCFSVLCGVALHVGLLVWMCVVVKRSSQICRARGGVLGTGSTTSLIGPKTLLRVSNRPKPRRRTHHDFRNLALVAFPSKHPSALHRRPRIQLRSFDSPSLPAPAHRHGRIISAACVHSSFFTVGSPCFLRSERSGHAAMLFSAKSPPCHKTY